MRAVEESATSMGVGWRLLWVLLAVVLAVGVGYLVGSSDTATISGVVTNADEASALRGEKEALTSVDSSTSRSLQAYTDRLNGLAEQRTGVGASGHDGAAAADAANALRQDGQGAVAGHDGAAAAEAGNALARASGGEGVEEVSDGAAAVEAANALAQARANDAEDVHEQEIGDRLVARGLVPGGADDHEGEVLDRLVARGLVPSGNA